MAKSLQDQLLGLGVVDKKKANQVKKQKRQQTKQKVKQGIDHQAEEQARLQLARQQKAEKDRALNQQKQQLAEQKAIQAQIDQIITLNSIEYAGDVAFSYVVATKIRHIYITDKIQQQLSQGRLVIVSASAEQIAIIGHAAADKIQQRDADRILFYQQAQNNEVIDDDDPYADFAIPDDLMW